MVNQNDGMTCRLDGRHVVFGEGKPQLVPNLHVLAATMSSVTIRQFKMQSTIRSDEIANEIDTLSQIACKNVYQASWVVMRTIV